MKKILLILMLLIIPTVLACDMDDHGSATGAAIAEGGECGLATSGMWGSGMMSGFGMMGTNYLGLIIFLYFVIGLGYVIYKINQIETKIGRKK